MKVYFCNDTSLYHAGSKAVCDYIKRKLADAGYEIIAEDFSDNELEVIRSCDVVLVNGEGTMHHGCKRALKLLASLSMGQKLGKKTHLVNTVWQSMGSGYTAVLEKLDSFTVREAMSFDEVVRTTALSPDIYLDFSYWSHRPDAPKKNFSDVDFTANPVVTDFYSVEFGSFVRPTGGWLSRVEFVDMKRCEWVELAEALSAHSMLLTGRHHGVYASCVVSTPFLPFRGNTHKIEGLFRSAGVCIPISETPKELKKHFLNFDEIKAECFKLFDWMNDQPEWPGI